MRLACSGLFSFWEKNVTLVVPSRLPAAVAWQQFADEQLRLGSESWVRAPVLSLGAWLTRCWQEARYTRASVPTLLSPSQEHSLWTQIIGAEKPDLFDLDATAGMASRAARLLAEWEFAADAGEWSDFSDASHFQRWLQLFRRRCEREDWMTRADLWRKLPTWITEGSCALGSTAFLLDGAPAPALSGVLQALGRRASFQRFAYPRSPLTQPGKAFANSGDELDYAARWARRTLETNPGLSIAVVVPGLPGRAHEIERAFRDSFYSGACRARLDNRLDSLLSGPRAFNVSPPSQLGAEPMIEGARLLLQLVADRITVSAAGAILRSRWIAGASLERNARAAADGQLRRLRELDVSLADIEAVSGRCPRLRELWPGVHEVLDGKPEQNTFSGWSRFIGDLLEALGWPGEDELTSREQSVLEAWKNTLSQFGALSLVADPVSFRQAREQLDQLLASNLDREGGLLSPVQILGVGQAAGLEFDCALVTGLGEETWPPRVAQIPFIPLNLARQQQRAVNPADQLQDILHCAASVTVTWSGRLSPAASFFVSSGEDLSSSAWQGKTTWQSYKPAILDEVENTFGPVYQVVETARGGTGIIKSQSLCPFRAFAEYRLASSSLEEGCLGLDSRERGGNLHSALQFVWQKLGTLDRLKATPAAELRQIVDEAAAAAIRLPEIDSSFGSIVTTVELERLRQVTLDWLNVERERLQPFTVETVEEEQYIELAGLKLRLRLDRMDRLKDGGLILIDYKSGEQKQDKLKCPRPREPQLLVYAAGIGKEVEGIVFAQLKRDDIRPVGWTRDRHFKKERRKTVDPLGDAWDSRMSESRAEVERLAEQFKSGYAAVDPVGGACDYCSQKPFCRINEVQEAGGAEEE